MKSFHKLLGQEGERIAERYLKAQGLVPVLKNARQTRGEIDLIFSDDEHLIFVEVKTMTEKSTAFFGTPSLKVDREKRRRITLAAAEFLHRNAPFFQHLYPRFDVVEVTLSETGAKINHIPNAFEAEDGFHKKKLF